MARALYPGSFDPPTRGHIDLVRRAVRVFESLTVGVGRNPDKRGLFSVEERIDMLTEVLGDDARLSVAVVDGLVVDHCRAHDIQVIVRGLRTVGDFEFEAQMAQTNRNLDAEVETMFLVPDPSLAFVSSSLIKDIVRHGGDASAYLHPTVEARLRARLAERKSTD